MPQPQSSTIMTAEVLSEAFPRAVRSQPRAASLALSASVDLSYKSHRFSMFVSDEEVLIPARILFRSAARDLTALQQVVCQLAQCLLTRSTDGFVRQAALREILLVSQPWSVPFVIALIGEYVIEILDDICEAIASMDGEVVRQFLTKNPAFYSLTRDRVESYWTATTAVDFSAAN